MIELSEETKDLLVNLFRKRRIGGKHTEEKNCLRRLNNLPPEKHKKILKEWEMCIKEGLILKSIKTGEFHVSLNPRKLKEVHEILD